MIINNTVLGLWPTLFRNSLSYTNVMELDAEANTITKMVSHS